MKKLAAITLTSMMLLLATAMVVGAVPSVEVRGQVAGTVDGASNLDPADNSFKWDPQNFAGFFYDIKKDLGKEELKVILTGEGEIKDKLSGDAPRGIIYKTSTQSKAFERSLWGSYNVIGFQAEKYFAGYNQGATEEDGSNIFFKASTDKNSLSSEQLQKILMDNKDDMTVTSGTPLKLGEGYELAIKSIDIDGNKVYVELSKDGAVLDSKVISPSRTGANELDKTYYYKNPAVGEQKKLVTIAVHFKNAFRGSDTNLASIDGVWQISDTPTEVKADTQYGKMTIDSVDATNGIISMNNKDNPVTLSKNKDTELMPGIRIKRADNDTLRFYIYKLITEPGDYQIRGKVAGTVNGESNLVENSFTWTPQTFAGFFYDIKKDLGKEELKVVLTGEGDKKDKLSGNDPYGIIYTTSAQSRTFEYEDWGHYNIIGFLGRSFLVSYVEDSPLQHASKDSNLCGNFQYP